MKCFEINKRIEFFIATRIKIESLNMGLREYFMIRDWFSEVNISYVFFFQTVVLLFM